MTGVIVSCFGFVPCWSLRRAMGALIAGAAAALAAGIPATAEGAAPARGAGVAAPAAGEPAAEIIVLVPLEVSAGLGVTRADLESAVMRGLAVAGRPLVASADASARAARAEASLACRDAACWARLGKAVAARWLVTGHAGKKDGRFRVQFHLRGADGNVVATEDNDCEVADCSIAELARRSARELVRQTLGRRRVDLAAGDPTPPASPAVEPPEGAAADAALVKSAPPADDGRKRRRKVRRMAAYGALGAGVLAVAGGTVALLAFPDKCAVQYPNACHQWDDYSPTRVGGVVAIAAGAVASAVGAYLLITDRRGEGPAVAVGIGPGGLNLAGRF